MKKIILNFRAILKTLPVLLIVAAYWYWVNQHIISGTGQTISLVWYFFLMSVATAQFPLPANLIVLGAVKTHDPLTVAFIGGLATLVAYLLEYYTFTLLFKVNRVANFKNTWVYKKVAPLFNKQKFFILTFTSFLPIPAEALRVYAITQKYSKLRFILSGFIGRVPRYFLLGYYGRDYINSIWFIIAVFIFPALFLLVIRGAASLYNLLKIKFYPQTEIIEEL